MGLFHSDNVKEKQHKGILGAFAVDVIKWEPEEEAEASLIVHKFEYEDFPNGSYLIVAASQMAVFTNNMAAGSSMDESGGNSQVSVFSGPCKIKLDTGDSRFAPFRNIAHALTGGESEFHSTVYFINTNYMNELKWGTQQAISLQDPEEEVNIHVRANGMFGVHIEQTDTSIAASWARKFLQKVVGTRADYSREELIAYMRAKILEYVPDLLGKAMIDKNVGILKISRYLSEFSEIMLEKLKPYFENFGLILDNFSFHSINAPDEDLEAINEMKIKKKRDQLDAEGNAKRMDIESEARARMRAREGYSYQQEEAFKVMKSAAENEGMSSTFMGAGMGLGMGTMMGAGLGAGMGNIARSTLQNENMMETVRKDNDGIVCKACNNINKAGAKFCLNCGEKLGGSLRVCPDCGAEIAEGAKFCIECGKKLAFNCPSCNHPLSEGAKFCVECGYKL